MRRFHHWVLTAAACLALASATARSAALRRPNATAGNCRGECEGLRRSLAGGAPNPSTTPSSRASTGMRWAGSIDRSPPSPGLTWRASSTTCWLSCTPPIPAITRPMKSPITILPTSSRTACGANSKSTSPKARSPIMASACSRASSKGGISSAAFSTAFRRLRPSSRWATRSSPPTARASTPSNPSPARRRAKSN